MPLGGTTGTLAASRAIGAGACSLRSVVRHEALASRHLQEFFLAQLIQASVSAAVPIPKQRSENYKKTPLKECEGGGWGEREKERERERNREIEVKQDYCI